MHQRPVARVVRGRALTAGRARDADRDAELAALCAACGACCDGTLFGRVSLGSSEDDRAARRRLALAPDASSFNQPCPAHSTQGCTFYGDRPRGCRSYECLLYRAHREHGGDLDARISVVRRVAELVATGENATATEREELMSLIAFVERAR